MSDFSSQLSLMREQYDRNPLRRAELSSCPIEQFELWLSEVVTAKLYDPNACSLSTVASDGQPVARAVLLKGVESGEFIFYTISIVAKLGICPQILVPACTFLGLLLQPK